MRSTLGSVQHDKGVSRHVHHRRSTYLRVSCGTTNRCNTHSTKLTSWLTSWRQWTDFGTVSTARGAGQIARGGHAVVDPRFALGGARRRGAVARLPRTRHVAQHVPLRPHVRTRNPATSLQRRDTEISRNKTPSYAEMHDVAQVQRLAKLDARSTSRLTSLMKSLATNIIWHSLGPGLPPPAPFSPITWQIHLLIADLSSWSARHQLQWGWLK